MGKGVYYIILSTLLYKIPYNKNVFKPPNNLTGINVLLKGRKESNTPVKLCVN